MKNFSNYNDYSTKEELHFESKQYTGTWYGAAYRSRQHADLSDGNFPSSGTWESTGFAYSRLENPTRQELERTMAILEVGSKFAFSADRQLIWQYFPC